MKRCADILLGIKTVLVTAIPRSVEFDRSTNKSLPYMIIMKKNIMSHCGIYLHQVNLKFTSGSDGAVGWSGRLDVQIPATT